MSDLSASSSHMGSCGQKTNVHLFLITNAEYHNATANKETSFLRPANLTPLLQQPIPLNPHLKQISTHYSIKTTVSTKE